MYYRPQPWDLEHLFNPRDTLHTSWLQGMVPWGTNLVLLITFSLKEEHILVQIHLEVRIFTVGLSCSHICGYQANKVLSQLKASPCSVLMCCKHPLLEFSCWVVSGSFTTPWTVARQAPLFTGFSRQEYWSGFPCPPPGDLPNPGIEPTSLVSPALAGRYFTSGVTWEANQTTREFPSLLIFEFLFLAQ